MGSNVNPVWQDKRAIPVFPDNDGGEAWPWKPGKIPRDKPSGSKNTVNEKKLTFRLLESQNSHKCCVFIGSGRLCHHSPRLWRQFINSMGPAAGVSEEGAVLDRSQDVSTSSTSKYRTPLIFFQKLILPQTHKALRKPLSRVFSDNVVWPAAAKGASSEPLTWQKHSVQTLNPEPLQGAHSLGTRGRKSQEKERVWAGVRRSGWEKASLCLWQ